jgi:thiol-disulfide isomerase/thioredoxin
MGDGMRRRPGIRRFVALASAAWLALAGGVHAQVRPGEAPPDLLGTDPTGVQVHVGDYRGKVVVLAFWATWCPYCLKELPILENLQRRVGKDRIQVVAIDTDADHGRYRAMRRRLKGFQLMLAEDEGRGRTAGRYGVTGLPHMVMIDKAGRVAHVHVGYSEEMLGSLVDEINALLDAPALPAAQAGG